MMMMMYCSVHQN